MAEPAESMESLIQLSEHGLFDNVLHYALLLGAIFQLLCILAVIVVPPRERDEWPREQLEADDGCPLLVDGEAEKKSGKTGSDLQTSAPAGRSRRSENKKRR